MESTVEYTSEFFASLEKLLDRHPHTCRACGVADGEKAFRKNGTQDKSAAVVRLALIDPAGPPNRAENVAMFCTKCRRAPRAWQTPRRIPPSKLPQLFPDGQ